MYFMKNRVFWDIVYCKEISKAIKNSSHCCNQIISVQDSSKYFQLAEPWSGNITVAKILFISSNPSISSDDKIPTKIWKKKDIKFFYEKRFRGYFIKDGSKGLKINKTYKNVSFWSSVKARSTELLPGNSVPGESYALTEIVHCKSKDECGVSNALSRCTKLYMDRILGISGAKVLIILGKQAESWFKSKYSLKPNIHFYYDKNAKRYLIFLPHPNARVVKKKISDYLNSKQIGHLQKVLS